MSKSSQSKSTIFRPAFSLAQIQYLSTLCKTNPCTESLAILRKLELLEFKAGNGLVKPAYIHTPLESLEDKLGFSQSIANGVIANPLEKIARKESLYHIWLESPAKLSSSQLSEVMDYKYGEGLMTPTEKEEYERENGLDL